MHGKKANFGLLTAYKPLLLRCKHKVIRNYLLSLKFYTINWVFLIALIRLSLSFLSFFFRFIMLVPCANLSRSRTIFQTVYKQEIFVLKKRNIWTPKFEPPKFWNTPFGYYFKPSNSKFKKGTPEYKRFWRFWNKVLGLINVPLISYFIEKFNAGYGLGQL